MVSNRMSDGVRGWWGSVLVVLRREEDGVGGRCGGFGVRGLAGLGLVGLVCEVGSGVIG